MLRVFTGQVSLILSVDLRPGLRSSKLNNCFTQEPAEGYKMVIAYSVNVSVMWQPWEKPAVVCG